MYVRALKPFTEYLNGAFFSPAAGSIFETTSEKGAALISEGLAEEYTLITPTGTKSITENGSDIDVAQYAKADVAVPQPTGNVELTENGTDIDIAQYATATVAVPNPSTGSLEITTNDTYDVTQYAQVVVNVGG
jgi:hypothetical protein